nr:GNAT family N-acetyltransferase [Kribbella sp. VKM Ac-2566]
MFVIVTEDGERAGLIGYWEHSESDETVWETGWAILPEFQGRGLATAAVREVAKVSRFSVNATSNTRKGTGCAATTGLST